MKVYFERIFQLNDGYQEILVDENNFQHIEYNHVLPNKRSVCGLVYDDIYILEPKQYYSIVFREDTPGDFQSFNLSERLLMSGLVMAGLNKQKKAVFVYNCTTNYIYIKDGSIIGEIE